MLFAGNVHNMLCCDEKMSLKETFVSSSICQHLVTFLHSVTVSLLLLYNVFCIYDGCPYAVYLAF